MFTLKKYIYLKYNFAKNIVELLVICFYHSWTMYVSTLAFGRMKLFTIGNAATFGIPVADILMAVNQEV